MNSTTRIWIRYPLLRVFLFFIAGIICSQFIRLGSMILLILFMLFLFLSLRFGLKHSIFFGFQSRIWFGVFVCGTFLMLGLLSSSLQNSHPHNLRSINGFCILQLEETPIKKEKSYAVKSKLIASNDRKADGNIQLYLQRSSLASNLHFGDRIIIEGKLIPVSPPKNPYQFDYQKFLAKKSIHHQSYIDSTSWKLLSKNHGNRFLQLALDLRFYLLGKINEWNIKDQHKAITKALLLGYRNDLDSDLLKTYASAGTMHVLAVSGLHVGIVYMLAFYLLFFLERVPSGKWIRTALLVILLWIFAMLTGLSPSVVRSATMFSLLALAGSGNRLTSVYNTLLASAFLLLIMKPAYLFDVGFQLSYMAVFGIVWLQPKLQDMWQPKFWPIRKAWAIICVSLAAQAATLPLGLYYFHQFPGLFLLSNLIVIPIISVLMYTGLISLAASATVMVPVPLVKFYDLLLGWMNLGVGWIEQQSVFLVNHIHITAPEACLIGVIIFMIGQWLFGGGYIKLKIVLVSTAMLLASQAWEQYRINNSRSLVVYAVNKNLALGIFGNGRAVLLGDSSLFKDPKSMGFHINNHLDAMDAGEPVMLNLNTDYQSNNLFKRNELMSFDGKSYFLYGKRKSAVPEADYWIISDDVEPPKEFDIPPELVILTGKLNYANRKRWISWCSNNTTGYWDTQSHGAWISPG